MNTVKKNQHYIPKFYLRNFSYHNNKKQIGVYNLANEVFYQTASLKHQGSKNFFYGYDGKIEDRLSDIEGKLADIISKIIFTRDVPPKNTDEHYDLLLFVALTDVRNPISIEGFKDSLNEMRRQILDMHPQSDIDNLIPNPNHNEVVEMHLANIYHILPIMLDLDYKILINNTITSFITSDLPIVKYNQYLEQKKWNFSKSGYGLTGLQIFIPLNKELMVVFFDKDIYKIGDKKKKYLNITSEKNIDDLNKLQFINCFGTIFFDDSVNENYIQRLHTLAKKFDRAHTTRSEVSYIIKEGDEENRRTVEAGFKNLIMVNKTDCQTNLQVDGIKIHSKGRAHTLNDSLAQLRPHAARLREQTSR
jgi:hypothetical protein